MVNDARVDVKVSHSAANQIGQMLIKLFVLAGLRKDLYPKKDEFNTIIAYIQEEMQQFTIKDFEVAFKLFMKGELDYQDGHFQNFSLIFLEKVMQSYRRLQVTVPKTEVSAIEEKTSLTDDQKEFLAYQNTLRAFEVYKSTMQLFDFGNAVYEYLRSWGCLKQSQEGYNRRIERAKKELIKEAKDSVNDLNKKMIMKVIAGLELENDDVISRAKTIRVMDFFDYLIEKGIELKEVLK